MRFTYFKTESAKVQFITTSVVWIFFFNYGVMYLLAPMDIDIIFLLKGIYTDFNSAWYVSIGPSIILS